MSGPVLPVADMPDWDQRKLACDRCESCQTCVMSDQWEPTPTQDQIAIAEQETAAARTLAPRATPEQLEEARERQRAAREAMMFAGPGGTTRMFSIEEINAK